MRPTFAATMLLLIGGIPVLAADLTVKGGLEVSGQIVSNETAVPPLLVSSPFLVSNLNADMLDGLSGNDFAPSQGNVLHVSQTGPLTSIQLALDRITDAGANNPYLVRVGPGTYAEQVTMKPFVDIEGSGEGVTVIAAFGGPVSSYATVTGSNAELRHLTVRNLGGDDYAIAINNPADTAPRLSHVTAIASAGILASTAIRNYNSSATLTHVTASASGGDVATGIHNLGGINPTNIVLGEVTATAADGASASFGIRNWASSASVELRRSVARAAGGALATGVSFETATGLMQDVDSRAFDATENRGVRLSGGVDLPLTNVLAEGRGGETAVGLYLQNSNPTIRSSSLEGSEGSIDSVGLWSFGLVGSFSVEVQSSRISGPTSTIVSGGGFSIFVGGSLLDGGAINTTPGGTVTCAGVYDEAYTFSASSCP